MMRSPYTSAPPRRSREFLALILAVVVAAAALAAGYAIAAKAKLPVSRFLPLNQPTPIPTIQAFVALAQIQEADPTERVSFATPLTDELDLVTTDSIDAAPTYTPQFATHVLAIYLRGYPQQTFWRWIDQYTISNTAIIYEVHRTELWVIHGDLTACTYTWTAYAITAPAIITRGDTGGDYLTGVASHPGSGDAPISLPGCGL